MGGAHFHFFLAPTMNGAGAALDVSHEIRIFPSPFLKGINVELVDVLPDLGLAKLLFFRVGRFPDHLGNQRNRRGDMKYAAEAVRILQRGPSTTYSTPAFASVGGMNSIPL
jgi:hypothetical protein